jgi:trehalose 6-phosphate phosphatase
MRRCGTPHLFEHWEHFAKRLRACKHLTVFFDFDGTLVPIAAQPHLVRLAPETRRALQHLVSQNEVTVGIISGRRRADIQRHIGLRNIAYLGLYGWERTASFRLSSAAQTALLTSQGQLMRKLASYPRVWIEPKQCSFSIHLLGTSAEIQAEIRWKVRSLLGPHKMLRVFENLRDIEIVPLAIKDKGRAVRDFLEKPRSRSVFPVYFGDDLSDESAFAAVRNGISVLVGERPDSHAQFYLRDSRELTKVISRMAALHSVRGDALASARITPANSSVSAK